MLARSKRVGYRRKKDLAAAVGSSNNQLTKWLQMERPPDQMRKMFDHNLAAALKIDRRTLFLDWEEMNPGDAPEVSAGDGPVPWETDFPDDDANRDAINEMVGWLRGDNLIYIRAEVQRLFFRWNGGS